MLLRFLDYYRKTTFVVLLSNFPSDLEKSIDTETTDQWRSKDWVALGKTTGYNIANIKFRRGEILSFARSREVLSITGPDFRLFPISRDSLPRHDNKNPRGFGEKPVSSFLLKGVAGIIFTLH